MSKGFVSDAVILMAGSGSRLRGSTGETPKPLIQIGGQPVISYALAALEDVGVRNLYAVVGADADLVVAGITPLMPQSIKLRVVENKEWRKQNGVSLLAAQSQVTQPFVLLMGDHLFEVALLRILLEAADLSLLNLAIDLKIAAVFDLDDAMKVRTKGLLVDQIGKDLTDYDAIDTGLFVCPPSFFGYLEGAKQKGDCSLADGVRLMAAEGKVRAIDIGDCWWQDIDTPEMLRHAAARLLEQGSGNGTVPLPESNERFASQY